MHTSLHWPQEEISQDRNTTRTPSSRGERPREEDTWPGREEMGLGPPRRSGPQARKWSWWQNLESSLLPLAQGEGDGIPPSELKSQVPSSTLLEDRRQRSLRRLLALQAQDTATTGPGELLDQQHLTTQQSLACPIGWNPQAPTQRDLKQADTAKPRAICTSPQVLQQSLVYSTEPSAVRSGDHPITCT